MNERVSCGCGLSQGKVGVSFYRLKGLSFANTVNNLAKLLIRKYFSTCEKRKLFLLIHMEVHYE